MTDRYKIVRMFSARDSHGELFRRPRTIKRGLTLEQAQDHCRSPETSSRTCKSSKAIRYTRANGPWFDGYEQE